MNWQLLKLPLSWQKRITLAILIVLGLASVAAVSYFTIQNNYTIYDGEKVITVSGQHETVANVLSAAEITLRAEDIVVPAMTELVDPQVAIQIQRAQPVTVRTEANVKTVWTQQKTVGALLAEANITIRRTTEVFAHGRKIPFNQLDNTPLPNEVEIGRFHTVTIKDGPQQQTLRTAAQTVGEALTEAGITLYAADGVQPPLGSWLEADLLIEVQRSHPFTIHVDGQMIQTRSHHTTVTQIVAEAGIGLIGYDYTIPGPEATLQPHSTIQIIRVTEDFRLEDETIPYQTIWQASDQLALDTQAILTPGTPGLLRRRIRVRYENGIEVSQTTDGEWVSREPINEVMGYGTRITIGVVDTAEGPREYWRVVRMRVTSYTAASSGKSPGDPGYGLTASGLPAAKGVVAADRSIIPFRSHVYVPGYGIGFVGDTGGGVRGRWIDLGYSEDDYVPWSGYVDVYYLTPIPAPEDINYILPSALP